MGWISLGGRRYRAPISANKVAATGVNLNLKLYGGLWIGWLDIHSAMVIMIIFPIGVTIAIEDSRGRRKKP